MLVHSAVLYTPDTWCLDVTLFIDNLVFAVSVIA